MRRIFLLLLMTLTSPALSPAVDEVSLTPAQASHFAALALKGISKEYPHKLDHIMRDADEVKGPRELHPAFYGCFDWHSSVHGHWMLVRLLKKYPDLPEAVGIRAALRANLTKENLATETEYVKQKGRGSFERTYGWSWLLK